MKLDLRPWAKQVLYRTQAGARKNRVSGGRGILKTHCGMQMLTLWTLASPRQGMGVFTCPFRNQLKQSVWESVNVWLEDQPSKIKMGENATDLTIKLVDGKSLGFIGLDKYEHHRGIHPLATVNDEVSRSKKVALMEVMGPASLSHKGPELDITTPAGHNWWESRWAEGLGPDPETLCWQIRAEDVGMISKADLLAERRRLTAEMYAQEWEGEFTGSAGGPEFPAYIEKVWPGGHLLPPGLVREEQRRGGYLLGALDWAYTGTAVLLWLWVTKAGGVIVLDELAVTHRTPAEMMTQAKARPLGVPPRIVLDYECWGLRSEPKSIADSFRHAAPRTMFKKSDKRFPDSINRIREMMTMEGEEVPPKFTIEVGKAPVLRAEILNLQEEDEKLAGGGFKEGIACDATDALRYGVMEARGGIGPIEVVSATKGPLWDQVRARVTSSEEILGFDPLTGRPKWGGANA